MYVSLQATFDSFNQEVLTRYPLSRPCKLKCSKRDPTWDLLLFMASVPDWKVGQCVHHTKLSLMYFPWPNSCSKSRARLSKVENSGKHLWNSVKTSLGQNMSTFITKKIVKSLWLRMAETNWKLPKVPTLKTTSVTTIFVLQVLTPNVYWSYCTYFQF